MLKIAVFLVVLALGAAELVPPPACSQYLMAGSNGLLSSTQGSFLPNTLFYDAVNLMSGSGTGGPFFSLNAGPNCYLNVTSTTDSLFCPITLYQDQNRLQPIGTGTISAQNTLFQSGAFFGGDLTLSYTIDQSKVSINPSPAVNYQSQTTTIHFEPSQMFPTDLSQPAIANALVLSSDQQTGFLTLWGSNGWNGSAFGSSRTTGFDFRAALVCNNVSPIIPPCSASPADTFTASYGSCLSSPVQYHSSSTTIALSFSACPSG